MPLPRTARIVGIAFDNFKAFPEYSLGLKQVNILVGPNNCGKSTVISALRALDSGLRLAKSRAPQRIFFDDRSAIGYRLPNNSLPLSLENVHSNYNSDTSSIIFNLNNKNKLRLVFPGDGGCVLIPDVEGYELETAALFSREFPVSLAVVPVLGPLEHNEIRRERSTVVEGLSTHRASRHFRNYWLYFSEDFDNFANLIQNSWPGMEIERPELDRSSNILTMFCREERRTREVYWLGFGFQIWLQLLTHLSRSKGHSLVIVDEPETYLHPDVQRQLLGIVRDIGIDVLLATHSSEIMSDADPSEIVLIDKRKRAGERLKDVDGVQRALGVIGSAQNITLTALARNRRVLFTEGGDDFRLLRRFGRRLGLQELGGGITSLPSKGFSSWRRITTLASGIAEALGASLRIAAIYDRDYYCNEQIDDILREISKHLALARVHGRKEIENYLLVPAALTRAFELIVREQDFTSKEKFTNGLDMVDILDEITGSYRDAVLSQLMAKRWEYFKPTGKDLADVNREAMASFNEQWNDLDRRLEIVPGKEVLRDLRTRMQTKFGVSLTDARIVEAMHRDEIPNDMQELLREIDQFRRMAAT
jgi:predicted ATPase